MVLHAAGNYVKLATGVLYHLADGVVIADENYMRVATGVLHHLADGVVITDEN